MSEADADEAGVNAEEAAEADEEAVAGRGDIWVEKYRPQALSEVAGHDDITDRLQSYIRQNDLPNLLFSGPAGVGKTTSALAIAREVYGDDWRDNFLELNASDERGIDVVRDRIKNFARSSFGGYDYRIIFLDEADSLTNDAQSALRRTMEQFSHNTRFVLSCNYSSKIIDPIQSRCAVFRFGPLSDEAIAEYVREIADDQGIETTEDGVDALVYAADGDMRKAINALQAAAVMGETVDESAVFTITSTARPDDIEEMVGTALAGDFGKARATLDELLTERGMAGGDVIDQIHRSVWEFDLDDSDAVRVLDRVGEADYRITEGANERVQLEAMLASLALDP
ncbi:replication factor C small subunit [Halomicrococcus gelatinilyticus]|uniref:replication factor C small subunit n=1 Tax=Halomicrococcus gelatinilyticus TaxID=1702103 RepID=UPI002E124480